MSRPFLRIAVIALIFFLVGVAAAAMVFAYLPDPGPSPAVYDDFKWSSTSNGFWHVNASGAQAIIKHSLLTLTGDSIELDRRMQTDPNMTVVVAKVRGRHFHKFGLGIGVWHAGTVGLEFDDDGAKCGRGTDYGWKVDFLKGWKPPPTNRWFYLAVAVKNPYPKSEDLKRAEQLADKTGKKLKPVTLTCSLYDAAGQLVASVTPTYPQPNAHYVGFDEVFMHTWDGRNDYQVDWFYAGPVSGVPAGPRLTGIGQQAQ